MTITVEEMKELTIFVKQHLLDFNDRHTHSVTEHIFLELKNNMEFMWWLKMHYPEALHEWNALNKMKES